MERDELLVRFRASPLPFAISAVGSAWERRAVDVRAVHGHALEVVRTLVSDAARQPDRSLAGLIVGQAGAGKTHLLGTLCNAVVPEAGNYSFAEVRPVIDPTRPLSHVLREVTGNLLQRPPGYPRASQLEAMSSRTVAGFLLGVAGHLPHLAGIARALRGQPEELTELVRAERYEWLVSQVCRWLAHRTPGVWEPALKAFFQYPLPGYRALSAAWLRGEELDDQELGRAGLPAPQGTTEEERAARTLSTLGLLLRYDRPLVICFDQIENLDTPGRRAAFGTQLEFLTTRVPGTVVLCAVRGDRWNALVPELAPDTIERFERSRIELSGCSRAQALELVRLRLATLPGGEPVPELFPFDTGRPREQLEEIIGDGTVPRVILQRANRLWLDVVHTDQLPPEPAGAEDPRDVLERSLAERRAAIGGRPERHGPDAPALAEAVRLVVGAHENAAFDKGRGAFQRAACVVRFGAASSKDACRIPVFVDTARHHLAVAATLRAAAAVLEGGEAAGAIYIRDGRLPIPKRPLWPATNDRKDAAGRAGALLLELEPEFAFDWLALLHVLQAVRSQDVTYLASPERVEAVTEEQLGAWLRNREPPRGMAPALAYVARHRPRP